MKLLLCLLISSLTFSVYAETCELDKDQQNNLKILNIKYNDYLKDCEESLKERLKWKCIKTGYHNKFYCERYEEDD